MDAEVINHGSLCLVHPRTVEAQKWIHENVSEDSQWFAHSLVVEPRFIEDLIQGMIADGLTLLFK